MTLTYSVAISTWFQIPTLILSTVHTFEISEISATDGFYHFSSSLTGIPTHVWYSHSLRAPQSSTYVVYNPTDDAKKHIVAAALNHAHSTIRPLALDVFLADTTIYSWDKEVSTLRAKLLKFVSCATLSFGSFDQ